MILSTFPPEGIVYQGESLRLIVTNLKDFSGNPITSPTSISLLITKPDSTQTTITSGISNDGGGSYHYDMQIAANDPVGRWSFVFTFVTPALTAIEESRFSVWNTRIQ